MARRVALAPLLVTVAACVAGCTQTSSPGRDSGAPQVACTRSASTTTVVLAGSPDVVAADAAQAFYTCAPVVVVANADSPRDVRLAAAEALAAHVPLLLTAAGAAGSASPAGSAGSAGSASLALRAEITALRTRTILAVGVPSQELAALPGHFDIVTDPTGLPRTAAPAPLGHAVLLAHQRDPAPGTAAAIGSARAAGARVIVVRGYDPRADPSAISTLSSVKPSHVVAVGARFGTAGQVANHVAVASTGVQLPGGGQVLFPMHRLVALYGHPGTPGLGALGEQSLGASIARARRLAAMYRLLSKARLVPTFEIIATVAQGANAGPPYSYMTPISQIRPWVTRATQAGMYVVLDLQPGRASLLAQAKWYQRLLELPNVGLALDPEWKLQPRQLPLKQIGSVHIAEVNSVITWLAGLTARYHLPQKLLVLHQFRLSMIIGERALGTRHDDLAIVIHMDGQGTPREKHQTWVAVTGAAPPGVFFGWKDFFVKDHPMLTPQQTMAHTPKPVMISYQ
jgi:hypothetical protein